MSFRLRKKEGAADGIHRVLREQIALAAGLLLEKTHQLELLQNSLDKPGHKLLRRLEKLSKILGEHHDLVTLTAQPAVSKSPVLRGVITQKIARRLKKARRLAKEIFFSSPRTFLASVRAGWKDWRG